MRNFAVSISNVKGLPVIYKGDPQKLTLSITNLDVNAVVPDEVELFLPDNLYFQSSINADSVNNNWKFTQQEGGGKFRFTGKAGTILAEEDCIDIYINNLEIVPEERMSGKFFNIKVKIGPYIYDVDLSMGSRRPTDLISIELSSQEVYIKDNFKNSFDLRIMNTAVNNIRAKFTVSFPIGSKKQDLTDDFGIVDCNVTQSSVDIKQEKQESTCCWEFEIYDNKYLEPDGVIVLSFSKLIATTEGTSKINVTIDEFEAQEDEYEYDLEFVTLGIKKTELPFEQISNFQVELSSDKYYYPKDEITASLSWEIFQVSSVKLLLNGVEKHTIVCNPKDRYGSAEIKITIVLGNIDKVNTFEIHALNSEGITLAKLSKTVNIHPIGQAYIDGRLVSVIKLNDIIWMAEDYYVTYDYAAWVKNIPKSPRTSWFSVYGAERLRPKNGWRLPTEKECLDLIETYRVIDASKSPEKAGPADAYNNLRNMKYYFNSYRNGEYPNKRGESEYKTWYLCKIPDGNWKCLVLNGQVNKQPECFIDICDNHIYFTVRYVKELKDVVHNNQFNVLI